MHNQPPPCSEPELNRSTQEHRVWLACSVSISLILLINALFGPIDDRYRPIATLNAVLLSPVATQCPYIAAAGSVQCAHVRGSQRRLVPFWPGCCRDCCSASVSRTTGAPRTLLPSSNTPQSRSKRPLWRPIDHI